jgi:hypothetical protein
MAKKGFNTKRIEGLIITLIAFLIFFFRPYQTCHNILWIIPNLVCSGLGLTSTIIAGIISIILLITGIVLLIRG